MDQKYTKLLADILRDAAHTAHITPGEIPDIDLYMDQVTRFMEDRLAATKRYEDDKILTKTMINNYTKNKLLPPPAKKRYSKQHMLVLIFIYYFKEFLPLADIQAILQPITEKFFQNNDAFSIEDIYSEIYELSKNRIRDVSQDITKTWRDASKAFEDCPKEDQEYLQLFSFICMLSFDIYLKKQTLERLLDHLSKPDAPLH